MTSITFFFIFIPILAFILLTINFIFAPHSPYQEKASPFECGFHSFLGQNRTQFSISFFIFALLFLLFDLEILLVYPYAVSAYVNNLYGLIIMLIFFLVLTLGFTFELGKNALNLDSRQYDLNNSLTTKVSSLGLDLYKEKNNKLFYFFCLIIGFSIIMDIYYEVTCLISFLKTCIYHPEIILIGYIYTQFSILLFNILKSTKYYKTLVFLFLEIKKNNYELLICSIRCFLKIFNTTFTNTIYTITVIDIFKVIFSFIFLMFIDLILLSYISIINISSIFCVFCILCLIYFPVYNFLLDKKFKHRNPFLYNIFFTVWLVSLIIFAVKLLIFAWVYIRGKSLGNYSADGAKGPSGEPSGDPGGGPDMSYAAGSTEINKEKKEKKEKYRNYKSYKGLTFEEQEEKREKFLQRKEQREKKQQDKLERIYAEEAETLSFNQREEKRLQEKREKQKEIDKNKWQRRMESFRENPEKGEAFKKIQHKSKMKRLEPVRKRKREEENQRELENIREIERFSRLTEEQRLDEYFAEHSADLRKKQEKEKIRIEEFKKKHFKKD